MTQIPLFQPPSEWTPPEKVPDLSDAKEIAIDLETYCRGGEMQYGYQKFPLPEMSASPESDH